MIYIQFEDGSENIIDAWKLLSQKSDELVRRISGLDGQNRYREVLDLAIANAHKLMSESEMYNYLLTPNLTPPLVIRLNYLAIGKILDNK